MKVIKDDDADTDNDNADGDDREYDYDHYDIVNINGDMNDVINDDYMNTIVIITSTISS